MISGFASSPRGDSLAAATRVKIGGKGVVTQSSVLMTTGSGPPVPVSIAQTQVRVKAL